MFLTDDKLYILGGNNNFNGEYAKIGSSKTIIFENLDSHKEFA
jgi:hypothetical protein